MLCRVTMSRSPWYVRPHCGVYVDTVTAEPPLQSTAAAARRLAGPGWGGRRRGRGGQTTGTTGRVTTTPLAPLVQQNWCTLYYGHWSSPCRHPALWLDQEPRHCFHDVWRWREGVRVIRTPARGGYGLSALLCCGMTWGGISTGVTRLSTVGVIRNETLVFVNFSAQDASILKISVPIIKRRS